MASTGSTCYIGTLAPELLDTILFRVESVRALGSLITTCQYVYRRFKVQETRILSRVLQNELGPVFTDAMFLDKFPYADPGPSAQNRDQREAYWDMLHTMTTVYMGMLCGMSPDGGRGGEAAAQDIGQLTRICHTLYDMKLVAESYISVKIRHFGGEEATPPSRTEELRVLRALYRRQIVCNAWAPTKRKRRWLAEDSLAVLNSTESQGARLGLLAAFEAWELQQIADINHFLNQLCTALCIAGQPVGLPLVYDDFGDVLSHTHRLAWYMNEHASVADRALHLLSSHPWLTIQDSLTETQRYFTEQYDLDFLRPAWQDIRLDTIPDFPGGPPPPDQPQEQDHNHQAGFEFSMEAVDQAPFGWLDALNGRSLSWFGGSIIGSFPWGSLADVGSKYGKLLSLSKLWMDAGFSLWDRDRIEAMKKSDLLKSFHTGWLGP